MNKEQELAKNQLRRALIACRRSGLGVYIWDGNVKVCPQPEGRDHERWDDDPTHVCEEIGADVTPDGLDCDGGAGC